MPKPATTDQATLLGQAMLLAQQAESQGVAVATLPAKGNLKLAEQMQALIRDAKRFRAFRPLGNLPDGTYFRQPPGGSQERSIGMRIEAVGHDIKVALPGGKNETWSSAAMVAVDASPTFDSQPVAERPKRSKLPAEVKHKLAVAKVAPLETSQVIGEEA